VLRQRLIYGPLLIAAILSLAWLDEFLDALAAPAWFPSPTLPPGIIVAAALIVVGVMGAREVARIYRSKGIHIDSWFAALVGVTGILVVGLTPLDSAGPMGFAAGISTVAGSFVVGLLYAVRSRQVEGAMLVGSGVLLIHVYMGLMLGCLLLIRREHSVWLLFWVIATVKACDIGAFFTGKLAGRTKLIPWLSPGKTWEGLAGGLVLSGIVGVLGLWLLGVLGIERFAPSWGMMLGVAFGFIGQGGDLAASLFKRDAGIKDAGTSMPGFGGMLDLIDSPVLVAPFAYWAITLILGADGGAGAVL